MTRTPSGVKVAMSTGKINGRNEPAHARAPVYILVANTTVERDLLKSFVEENRPFTDISENSDNDNVSQTPRFTFLTIAPRDEQITHDGLAAALDTDENELFVPIGVAWLPKHHHSDGRIRLIDLILQDHTTRNEARQRKVLRRHPERCAIVVGEPGYKDDLNRRATRYAAVGGGSGEFADYVARQAAITIEREVRNISDAVIKYPRFVREALWARRGFQDRLAHLAEETGRPRIDIETEALACIQELVPRVQPFYVAVSNMIFDFARRLGYEDKMVYDKTETQRALQVAGEKPTALLFTHKSHIDGIALIVMTRKEGFPLVHTIGGANMAFLGVGYIMRRAGAIFIRRKGADSPVYKAVLRHYLSYLLEKRFPVAWSIEGTRSRNGKLMPPRFGILKYVIEAAAKNSSSDLHIYPVSIYYDLIAELDDYAYEQTGGVKRPESLAWFIGYLRTLRKPLGRLSLSLGAPVVVDATKEEFSVNAGNHSENFSIELQKIGFEASVSANNATPITPTAIFSMVLTGAAPQALTEREILKAFLTHIKWARDRNLPMTEDLSDGDENRARHVGDAMIETGIVSRHEEGLEPVYNIAPDKYFAASYYRNSIIHFFVNKALIELALLKVSEPATATDLTAMFEEDIAKTRDLFKFEFFYSPTARQRSEIASELEHYDSHWGATIAGGRARGLLERMTPIVSHAVLRPFAEAYAVVAEVIMRLKPGDDTSEKAIVAAALRLGKQALLRRQITSPESIGKLMFSNAYKLADARGLLADKEDLTGARVHFARELKDLTQRIRLIDSMCATARTARDVGVRGLVYADENVVPPREADTPQPPVRASR